MVTYLTHYRCVSCGWEAEPSPFQYTCTACGENLDVQYDYPSIQKHWRRDSLVTNGDRTLWRYLPLLPVAEGPENRAIQVGSTPLIPARILSEQIGVKQLWIKDETRHPSGSLKDRATEVGLRHAQEQIESVVVAASTGNAGSSLACLAAWHGLEAVIVVPASAPKAKLTQILQYGARLVPVDGSYDDAFELSLKIAKDRGWYSRSTGINPVLSEGKKTVAFEIAEQLQWQAPDLVFVPVGDGCILGGVFKGFNDLLQLGWIDRLPKLVAVQAEGSAAVVRSWKKGKLEPVQAQTIADSIAVNRPRDGLKALRALKKSSGFGITVTDREILQAQHRLARTTGIFAEPAAAAPVAGLVQAEKQGLVSQEDQVVLLVTGTGLKDIAAAQTVLTVPTAIPAHLDAFNKRWEQDRADA
jgi:threonine synthase